MTERVPPNRKLSDDELLARYNLARELGQRQAAAQLGISRTTLREQIDRAVKRGLTEATLGQPLPEGYLLGKVTSLVSEDGTRMEWQHRHPELEQVRQAVDAILSALEDVPPAEPLPAPVPREDGPDPRLVVFPIPDVHLGQYSWAKETGENYDIRIATEQVKRTIGLLAQVTPETDTAIVLVLGDFFHADNSEATTFKSGNHMDVDSRYDKVLHAGAELLAWVIDLLRQKYPRVVVRVLPGNHDPHVSAALTLAMTHRYVNEARVEVDRTPGNLWFFQWGATMLAASHGDKISAKMMPGVMASVAPVIWGGTRHRYAYLGHSHKRVTGPSADEHGGAIWEIFQAVTARDAFNRSMGRAYGRSLTAIVLDREDGEITRFRELIR